MMVRKCADSERVEGIMASTKKSDNLVGTAAASELLGVSVSQFRRLVESRNILPDKTCINPNYRSGPPAALWGRRTLARLRRSKDLATARLRKGGPSPKDYSVTFAKRYATPHDDDAIAAACEALFNLNRYTRHTTCSDANREEIFDLKTSFIERLYTAERFTDRVEKLTKTLPEKACFGCDGSGCERCEHTGIFAKARDVASYVFTFTVNGRRYTWMQPDRVMAFEPRVEETKPETGAAREMDLSINIPRSKLAEAKALIRWVLGVPK